MANSKERVLSVYRALDREFEDYLTKIQEYQKCTSNFHPIEQKNIRQWIERLVLYTEVARQKVIRNEYAQYLCHLLKQGQIQYPFTKAPPPLDRHLNPLDHVVHQESNKSNESKEASKRNFKNRFLESRRETTGFSTGTSAMTTGLPFIKTPTSCEQAFQWSKKNVESCKFGASENFDNDAELNFRLQDDYESCEGHQYPHKEIQHIKLSPRQKRKLHIIQEERKNLSEDWSVVSEDVLTKADPGTSSWPREMSPSKYPSTAHEPCLASISQFPKASHKKNGDFISLGKPNLQLSNISSPLSLHHKQHGGTSDSPSRSNGHELNQMTFTSTRGSRYFDIAAGGVPSDQPKIERSVRNPKGGKTERRFGCESERVKACISCGRIMKQESPLNKPLELPSFQMKHCKTIWGKDSDLSIVSESSEGQPQQSENLQPLKILHGVKDDMQLILSNVDPDITLREFVLLFAPMLEDKGELMKNATGEEFFRFLKYVESIFKVKFEHAYGLYCSKYQSIEKDYSDFERKIAHQKDLFETEIRMVLPNFDWEEYQKNDEYLPKALEAANIKSFLAETSFQEARKYQHAELQAVKTEVEKVKRENLALKTEFESLIQQYPQGHQSEIGALLVLLNRFKTALQIAIGFHHRLESNSQLILEYLEKSEGSPGRRK